MCSPAAALMAVSIGQSISSNIGAYQTAKIETEVAEARWQQETAARHRDYLQQLTQIQERQHEVNQQAAEEMSDRAMEARKERARLLVAAGEAGIGGITPARLEQAEAMKGSKDISTLESARKGKISQLEYHKKILRERATGPNLYIQKPSLASALIGSGLGIAGAVAEYKSS